MARCELRAGGSTCSLEPQVFRLLALLVENHDRLVSKEEIIDKVWDGRVVSDAAVASRVKSARRALGDNGKSQRFIKTLHRQGFRFVANVKISRGAAPNSAANSTAATAGRKTRLRKSATGTGVAPVTGGAAVSAVGRWRTLRGSCARLARRAHYRAVLPSLALRDGSRVLVSSAHFGYRIRGRRSPAPCPVLLVRDD